MSVLLYMFLGLAVLVAGCFAASVLLNRKSIDMIVQLRKDIKESEVTLEEALMGKVDLDESQINEDVLVIERRFAQVERTHNFSKLFLYAAISLTAVDIVVLVAYTIVGN